jgi:ankyrin repeat protein
METTPDQKLYDLGSNPLVQDNEGNNPLHFILSKTPCEKSHFDKALALFIDKTPSLIHRKNEGGFKPLHIAIQTARLWPIETLIGTDADIREPDPDGNTILHFLAGNLCSHPLHSNEELISQVRHFLFSWLFDQSGQFLW